MVNELEKSIIKPIKKHKKVVRRIITFICALLIIYFGMSMYFMNHFYFGSAINSISVSGKVVEDVNKQMATEMKTYKITIKERGGKTEQISGDEVGLEYNSDGEFKNFKESQNPFKWISAAFNTKDSKMIEGIKYDTELLKKSVDNLSCFDNKNIVEPKNASYKYTDNGYVIVDEVIGNKGNKEVLYNKVIDAVSTGETTIDLESINYYVKPQYTSKSQKTLDTKDMLNKYVASKITYTFGDEKELLDASTINKWLAVDANSNVTFDEKEVRNYINVLSSKYNTVGNSRDFVKTSGKTINIAVGDYGWYINRSMETQDLITNIKEGKAISKEPAYSQTALFHGSDDMGNTYVEIDMTAQHLWFYKNGAIVTQGDVVTGNIGSEETATPAGIYKLKYKEKDATLKGQNYASPVKYWMPFNGNVGIHDASWRNTFGGQIYKTGGSHGCVNSPFELAKTVFENIETGTPVVCYY